MDKLPTQDWIQKELARVGEVEKRSVYRDAQKTLHALTARYDSNHARIVIELNNGADFSFPPSLAMGLDQASEKELSKIEVSPLGVGLHWPLLNVDLTVDGLLSGVFGSRHWMRGHASRAGGVSSPAKADAARKNGSKGGRPRALANS